MKPPREIRHSKYVAPAVLLWLCAYSGIAFAAMSPAAISGVVPPLTEQVYDPKRGWVPEDELAESGLRPLQTLRVKGLTLRSASIREALSSVLKDTGLRISLDGQESDFGVVSANNVSGSVADVLEEMADTLGFFYTVHGDRLLVSRHIRVTIALPDAADDKYRRTVVENCIRLGARDVEYDQGTNNVEFMATRPVSSRIHRLVQKLGEEREVAGDLDTTALNDKPTGRPSDGQGREPMATMGPDSVQDTVASHNEGALAKHGMPASSMAPILANTDRTLPAGPAAKDLAVDASREAALKSANTHPPRLAALSPIDTAWSAREGESLHDILRRWTSSVPGWTLEWEESSPPVKLTGSSRVWNGSFVDAVRFLFQSLNSNVPIKASLYTEERLLHVRGNANTGFSGWIVGQDAVKVWTFAPGDKLKGVVRQWAERAEWSLIWDAGASDMTLGSEGALRGSLADAMSSLERLVTRKAPLQFDLDARTRSIHVYPRSTARDGQWTKKEPVVKHETR